MAISAVAICNMALGRMGNGQTIDALTDGSAAAGALSVVYEMSRDDLLRRFPWGFAKRVVTVALVEANPTPEWAYSYQLPADCLMARRILPRTGRTSLEDQAPFEVIGSDTGLLLLADVQLPYVEYTARVTDETRLTADFISLFAWRLAKEVVIALTVNPSMAARIDGSYEQELHDAEAKVRQERRSDPPAESSFLTSRT